MKRLLALLLGALIASVTLAGVPITSAQIIPSPDGKVYSAYPNGDAPPTVEALAWDETQLSVLLVPILAMEVGTPVSINVRQALDGTDAATATIFFTQATGAGCTGSTWYGPTGHWSDPDTGTSVGFDAAAACVGTWRLRATGGTGEALTASYGWNSFDPVPPPEPTSPWPEQGAVSYLPIVPGLRGPGVDTVAGSGRNPAGGAGVGTTVCKVTSLANSGTGTLRGCVDDHDSRNSPTTIVFETSGSIVLSSSIQVDKPNLSIFGQTAPSPGIQITNDYFGVRASHVLIQHLTFRNGWDGVDTTLLDSLEVFLSTAGGVTGTGIVIDHNTFMWGADEVFSIAEKIDGVTASNNIIAEPVGAPTAGNPSNHRYGSLTCCGNSLTVGPNVLYYGNLWAHTLRRAPASNINNLAVVNNVIYNWQDVGTEIFANVKDPTPTHNSVVGNVYIDGLNTGGAKPVQATNNLPGRQLLTGSTLYVRSNLATETAVSQWNIVQICCGNILAQDNAASDATADFWPTGLVTQDITGSNQRNNEVYNIVKAFAGARPAQRDSITTALISDMEAGLGSHRDFDYHPWPTYAVNTRTFTVPANHNSIGASGYTLLEEAVQALDAEVLP